MAGLNLDVLREVCGFLTAVRDVMSFSRTCSTLRTIAVERRLSMRTITVNLPKSLLNLYNLISVDKGRRGPHIRAIDIRMYMLHEDFSEDVVDHFLALLAAATRLRTLTLHGPGHPRVLPAVAGLTSLQELEIAASMDVAAVLLGSTRSALKTFRRQDTYWCNGPPGSLSISIAPQLTLTLEELEVSSDFVAILSKSHVSLPVVRSLILAQAEVEEVCHWQVDVLLTVFPNLDRTLIIDTWVDDNGRLTALRGENRKAQKMRAWKTLDRVGSVSPDLLYALGLTCPIRHLTLDAPYEASASNVIRVRTILEECTPTHLALMKNDLSYEFPPPHWNSLFPENAVTKLTHLVLDTVYHDISITPPIPPGNPRTDDEEHAWVSILDSVLSALESLRLRHLTHVWINLHANISFHLKGVRRISRPIYDGLRTFQFDRLLAALPTVLPSLSYIFITSRARIHTEGREERWKVTRAWQVRRPCADTQLHPEAEGGMHDLEELPAGETEAMLDREGMHPTERNFWGPEYELDVESDSDWDSDSDSDEEAPA